MQWRELCGRGDGEWECEDTRGVQVDVRNKERVCGEKVNNEEKLLISQKKDRQVNGLKE